MVDLVAIRRPPRGGHFLFGLGHAQTLVLVIGVAVIVVLLIRQNRRR